ncbi:MAG: hypothetical protein V2B15_12405 [Bacteroidota bacterium]
MKKLQILLVASVAVILLGSCEKQGKPKYRDEDFKAQVDKSALAMDLTMAEWPEQDGCNVVTFDLIGGQHILMGKVTAITYAGSLFVKYEAIEGCRIRETHLFLGNSIDEMPVGNGGNPKIGQFTDNWEGDGKQVVVREIPLDGLGDCFVLAAHAVVSCPGGEETAWAREQLFFALKSNLYHDNPELRNVDNYTWGLTGTPTGNISSGWVSFFTYFSVAEWMNRTAPLTYYRDGSTPIGKVRVEWIKGNLVFTVTSDDGDVMNSHLSVGDQDFMDHLDFYNHYKFKYQVNELADSHQLVVPVEDLGVWNEFPGASRWGWYVNYCAGACR